MIIKYTRQIIGFIIILVLLAGPTSPLAGIAAACDQSNATAGCCATDTNCTNSTTYNPSQPLSADQATNCDQASCDIVNNYLNKAIDLASALVGLTVVISIIMGAIQFSASGGDPQKATNARNRIRNSVIALVAFLLLYSFLQFLIPGGLLHS